ncbi:ABC transporter ATP-binding protein [Mucilaginibacter sp. L3T2-6]|uniref:ABC transporter ATP-binding protein n=1 Tax=Mucilaginibacter sp. L3T2-6 TaxID=3062491 RepID=UPI002676A538|nr:ABC transporter ATP-binding protein [Mucilaginibacter sp. L3T2-6]MDO3643050.1 ABC transporter ATP-binding protein [Mucilaginibacter sp. L3T2-6]MDV6215817.1 ABC transporter ATP-binding protein [Mucilaginibacter sp. L3T2-6]
MAKVIRAENLSKAYQLGEIGTGTLSRDLERFWAKLRGKEDPFLKIGETNDRSVKGTSDVVWSLRDINFEIEQGDAVGIIGRNGAGKSTLLKILGRVTAPTAGSVKLKGRVASLLEVGTGFHPDLTGRENIYLNGAILGMRKAEIRRKFDEIVDFSGVERYVDTPVKRYSSGMYVRLAFAVAAHLESEIMIVDEVLAVGDAEFQKKCLGKMGDVSRGEGRTVLFVSHNMGAINNLCKRAIVLDKGSVYFEGHVNESIKAYFSTNAQENSGRYYNSNLITDGFSSIILKNNESEEANEFEISDDINISAKFLTTLKYASAKISFTIIDHFGRVIFVTENNLNPFLGLDKKGAINICIPNSILVPGKYTITAAIHIPNVQFIELLKDILTFKIKETGSSFYQYINADIGCVFVNCKWTHE